MTRSLVARGSPPRHRTKMLRSHLRVAPLARAAAGRLANSVSRQKTSGTEDSTASLLGSRPRSQFHRGRILTSSFYVRETEIVARDMPVTLLDAQPEAAPAAAYYAKTM